MATVNFALSEPTHEQLALRTPAPEDSVYDRLNACVDHLEAMACIATTEDFSLWNAELRDRYMWALCDKAKEVKRVMAAFNAARRAEIIVGGIDRYRASNDCDNPFIPDETKAAGGGE